jgi:hypothetical protein
LNGRAELIRFIAPIPENGVEGAEWVFDRGRCKPQAECPGFAGLGVFDRDVDISPVIDYARIQTLDLEVENPSFPVLIDQVPVRIFRLGILVEHPHVAVGGRGIQVEVVLLDILLPSKSPTSGMVVGKEFPGAAVRTVILPYGPTGAFTQIGPPLLPVDLAPAMFRQSVMFRRGRHVSPPEGS